MGRAIVAVASVAASLLGSHAMGGTYTWNGSANTSWGNDSNWTPNTGYAGIATTADEALFAGTPPANLPSLDNSYTVGTLLFSTAAGGWTLGSASSSNILSVDSAITTNQTSGTDTISANLDYGGSETWQAGTGGTLSITGSVSQNNGATYELTIGGSGLGTVSLNPTAAADNITGANATALVNVISGASLQLGGTGGSANTFSNTFNDTAADPALRFGSSNTTTTQSLVQVNSGRWNFTQIGANSTQATTGKMNIVGGTVAIGSAFSFGSYYGTNGTNLTVNGGAFLVTNGGANISNYGFNIGTTGNSPASGVIDQTSVQSGFFDVANGAANNSIFAPAYTGAGTTSYDLAEFNVSGGVAQFGVTQATNVLTNASIGATGGGTVTIGFGASTDTGSFLTGSLSAVTLSGGTLSAQTITGGVISGTNTITNIVRNFNFVGGTLSAGTITMTNLGSAGSGAASSPFGSNLSAATSNNIGTLEDYGGTISPGGSTYVYGADSYYNPVLTATPTTGLTAITGGLQINSGTLLITVGGTTASTHFQDSPTGGDYSNVTVSGAATLGGNLSLSLINSYVPTTGTVFTILKDQSGTPVAGSFANVANGGLISTAGNQALFQAAYGSAGINTVTLTTIAGSGSNVWNLTSGANWGSSTTNWSTNTVPNGGGANAVFGTALSSNGTVSLDNNYTVGTVMFANSAASYNISPGSGPFALTLNNNSAAASIVDAVGSHTISAPIAIGGAGTLGVSVTRSQDTLTLSGAITETSSAGTLTDSGAGQLVTGSITGVNQITRAAGTGSLSLGAITGIGTLTDNSTTGSTMPTTIAQSGSGLTVATVNGVSGSVVDFGGDTTGSTTITNALGVKGQLVDLTNGTLALGTGRHTFANLEVDGGTVLINNAVSLNRLGLDGNTSATQTLSITGGTLAIASSSYGLRVNGDSGPAANNSGNISNVAVTVGQTGGTLAFTGGGGNYLQLGSTSSSNTTTYNMSAGTISDLVNSGPITLGADAAGTSQTTFNFSGGNIVSYNGVAGSQGAGAKQAFVWTGGTLSVGTFNATNLASTTGSSTYGTLNNNGGTLAPGGVGTTGLTTIVGNYAGNGTGVLAFDINGASPSSSFQDTGAGSFDLVSVTGSVALNDRLAVTVLPGYVPPSSSTTYAVITSTSLVSGTFSGLTLVSTGIYSGTTTDGGYTYEAMLNDGGDNVTLTDFQPVPEPGAIGAIACGMGLLARRRRRASSRAPQAVAGS